MSSSKIHIRCYKCKEFNTNDQLCEFCGAILDYQKRRELEIKKNAELELAKELAKPKSNIEIFFDSMINHQWLLVRVFFKIIYGIWFAILSITMFIAWLFASILA
ncbi:hypothetical protein [Myroides sp. LJL119]